MLDAGMSTEHIARNVGCGLAIRNLRIIFQTTRSSKDLPRRGCPHVTTRGQDHCIMNTHLRNLFQTATAANTPGLHNNRISAQTVRNRLLEKVYMHIIVISDAFLTQHHCLNWAHVHTCWIQRLWNTILFSDE